MIEANHVYHQKSMTETGTDWNLSFGKPTQKFSKFDFSKVPLQSLHVLDYKNQSEQSLQRLFLR